MGPEKNIEYQFMENYQIKYEARHGPVPAYQFRENISLNSISLERVYCISNLVIGAILKAKKFMKHL